MSKPTRCPFHSRAWGCQCELEAGHEGSCVSAGDGFAGGWDPKKQPDPLKKIGGPMTTDYDRGYQAGRASRDGEVEEARDANSAWAESALAEQKRADEAQATVERLRAALDNLRRRRRPRSGTCSLASGSGCVR